MEKILYFEDKNKIINDKKIIIFKRNYGIDLSRIISMILIINHHIIFHGGPLFRTKRFSFVNKFFIFFNTISSSGVNIFGLISGCVGFKSHRFSNLFYLLIVTFFYNINIALIFKYFQPKLMIDLNHYLYPLFISDYWYFNEYFLMYFLLPLVNKGIISMNKNSFKFFNINIFLFFSCLGEIKNYNKRFYGKDILNLRRGFSYTWLLILYLYGGYLGKYTIDLNKNNNYFYYLKYFTLLFCFGYIRSKIVFYQWKNKNNKIPIIDYASPSQVIIAISIIIIFANINFKNKHFIKLISFFSPLTYGVYLIHNHRLMRIYIMKKYFLWLLKLNFVMIFLMVILYSLIIFLACSCVDYLRYLIFNKLKIKKICIIIEDNLRFIANKIFFFDI